MACCATGLLLALPGAAQAAGKTVSLGVPLASQGAFEPTGSEVNAFFPAASAVHVGDTVSFAVGGFHTVHFAAKGGKLASLNVPTPKKVTGILDAAGVPFWFNGQSGNTFNPAFFQSSFGKLVTYNGSKELLSGLPITATNAPPKPLRVKFTKAGLFKYICDLHSGMRGTIRVSPKGRPIAAAAADKTRVKKAVAAALTVAKGLAAATKPAANSVVVGPHGKGGVEMFAMLPKSLTVPAGTTVTFAMPSGSTEVHTASFGPGVETFGLPSEPDKNTYLGGIAAAFQGDGDPRADFPSEAPGSAPAALTPALHGNGFWNSGVMDAIAQSPLPASGKVTFTTPGSYSFACVIHSTMKGTITVT